jgi:hypothetical protein
MCRFLTAFAMRYCSGQPGLTDEARDAVAASAVAGQTIDPELIMAVAGLSEWPEELSRRGIVVETDSGGLAFSHALVRDAFYGEIPWTRRVALHRAVAERLEANRAAPVLVAEHWALGRRQEQARAALLAAAGGIRRGTCLSRRRAGSPPRPGVVAGGAR